MRKLFNKPWFVAAMATVALLLVGRTLLPAHAPNSRPAAPTANDTPPSPGETAVGPVERTMDRETEKKAPAPVMRRNPFALLHPRIGPTAAVAPPEDPDLVETVHLSALWTQNGETFLLLNDHICQPGEQFGRLKIESANQDGVWLAHWKGRDFLALGDDYTLTTPAKNALGPTSSL